MSEKVCPPDHKHATTTTCYVSHSCRCTTCRAAASARCARTRKLKAYGRYDSGRVDAAPVREHLQYLLDAGMHINAIAAQGGCDAHPLRRLISSTPQKRVRSSTAAAVFRVTPDISLLSDRALVDARGAHRRLQALVAIGWSLAKLGDRLGMGRENTTKLLQRDRMTAAKFRAIADLYEQLWHVQPPQLSGADRFAMSSSIRRATALGWLPPLAWDDIDLDEVPPRDDNDEWDAVDELAVELAMAGERIAITRPERLAAITRLVLEERMSDGAIAERLGISDRTVLRIRTDELHLPAAVGADREAVA